MHNQHTIKEVIEFEGIGLHSGNDCSVRLSPAEVNSGIIFTNGTERLKLDVSKVIDTQRCTKVGTESFSISTIEHLMAALYAAHIENVEIHVDGDEIPILDGSAEPFAKAIAKGGIVEQDQEVQPYIVDTFFEFKDEDSDAEYTLMPYDGFEVTSMIQYECPWIGQQFASLSNMDVFQKEIAPSRTFAIASEVKGLKSNGLIKGGTLENAIVFGNKKNETIALDDVTYTVNSEGILNESGLRSANEPAKHKLLDLIGDLALLGRPIRGKIIAKRPGHTSNVALVKELKKRYLTQRKLKGMPIYRPEKTPVYDIQEVSRMLPHKYPFLMVDKIIELEETYIVGVKNLTMNEEFFQGHFPNNPVFPGVMQLEAMAQTGGLLVLSTVEDPYNWDTYFMKMDNVKFKQKVIPGDTFVMKLELMSPVRRGIVQMQGTAYVGNKIVSQAELTAQIIKVRND